MSFLFGKKNKQQSNALPAATREITSSHGPAPPPVGAAPNGGAIRDAEKNRPGPQSQTPTPGSSVNNSFSSLNNQGNATAPEQKALRDRADPNPQVCWRSRLLHNWPRVTNNICRMPEAWVAHQTLHTRGRHDVLISPPATRSHATAPP